MFSKYLFYSHTDRASWLLMWAFVWSMLGHLWVGQSLGMPRCRPWTPCICPQGKGFYCYIFLLHIFNIDFGPKSLQITVALSNKISSFPTLSVITPRPPAMPPAHKRLSFFQDFPNVSAFSTLSLMKLWWSPQGNGIEAWGRMEYVGHRSKTKPQKLGG